MSTNDTAAIQSDAPKQYRINSLEDLLNLVNIKTIDILAVDVMQWLNFYSESIKLFRMRHPEASEGKTNYEILPATMIWIDDGKNEFRPLEFTGSKVVENETIEMKMKLEVAEKVAQGKVDMRARRTAVKTAEEWIKQIKGANPNGVKTEEHITELIRSVQKDVVKKIQDALMIETGIPVETIVSLADLVK